MANNIFTILQKVRHFPKKVLLFWMYRKYNLPTSLAIILKTDITYKDNS